MTLDIQSAGIHTQNQAKLTQEELNANTSTKHPTPEQAETGSSSKDTVLISDQAKRIQQATQALIQQPILNMDRVEQVRLKLQQGQIDLLNPDQAKAAADRIANNLVDHEISLHHESQDA